MQTLTAVNGESLIGPTKTSRSRRTVYLDPQTVAVLREHHRRQREERLVAGPAWDSSTDLVFRDEIGGLIHPDWFTREFGRVVGTTGLVPIRLHDYADLPVMPTLVVGVLAA